MHSHGGREGAQGQRWATSVSVRVGGGRLGCQSRVPFPFFPSSFCNCVTETRPSAHLFSSPIPAPSLLSSPSSQAGREAGWQLATSVAPCTQFPWCRSPRESEHKEKCSPYGAPTWALHCRANAAISLAGKSPFFVVLLSPLSLSLTPSPSHYGTL